MRHLVKSTFAGLLTVSAAAVLASCGSSGATVEDLAVLKGDGFTVQMPGKPERSVNTVNTGAGTVQVIAYIVEKGNTAYSAAYTEIPDGVQGDLDGAVSGAASNVGGKVAESVTTTHQGFPARDARITGAQDKNGNKGTVFSRVILTKERLYQLQFVGEGEDLRSPGDVYPKVRDSLDIK